MRELLKDEALHRHGLNTTGQESSGIDTNLSEAKKDWNRTVNPEYADEVPPFDITINFLNEYGQSASMVLRGVEILNEGMGMSIDDITTEKACTFIARSIDGMKPGEEATRI